MIDFGFFSHNLEENYCLNDHLKAAMIVMSLAHEFMLDLLTWLVTQRERRREGVTKPNRHSITAQFLNSSSSRKLSN